MRGTGPGVYFVNARAQQDGRHEVHRLGCPATLPAASNRVWLGAFADPAQAMAAAAQVYDQVDGCAYCLPGENEG
ncbi:hypothetical protein ICN82_09205 [Mangrovicoccus sp. HB182678]|uniref:Uncharacterized protein n=1 Tax=Mangrovicoccus algicola TaxID=2771008 RepID=A0A8J6YYK8_9RHOB|nr:hypothetical protein [Mangrovicoccus algicola]